MSLILEALKKSEQQRRLGEAPTLGSPVVSTRRRRSTLPVLAILIVIAAGAGWWLTRQPTAPPATTPAPPIVADKAAPAKPNGADATKPGQTAAANQERLRAEAAKRKAEQAKRIEALGNAKPNAPLGLPNAANTAAMPPQRKPGDPVPHATTPPKMPAQSAPPPANPAKADAAVATKPGAAATAPAAETASTTPPPAPVAKAPPAATPDAAALPTIWDLPFATRKDIPALDLSMHVYSSDPKQRFVVIKGERHVEGDEIASDLTLREIRQDGLVLDYKGQRFFFPRSGR